MGYALNPFYGGSTLTQSSLGQHFLKQPPTRHKKRPGRKMVNAINPTLRKAEPAMLLKSILFRVAVHRLRRRRQTERNPAFPDMPSVQQAGPLKRIKMAGDGGLEPPLPDPESGVLPLD